MSTRVSLLAATVAVAATVAAPAAHAEPPVLSVTGPGATVADFTVPRSVTYDIRHAVVRGTGRHAGLYLWDVGPRRVTFVSRVMTSRDVDARNRPVTLAATEVHYDLGAVACCQPVVTLTPGRRYRVLLLGDGDVDVRLPLVPGSATEGIAVTPRTRHPYTYAVKSVGYRAGNTGATVRLPITPNARLRYVFFASVAPSVADGVPGPTAGEVQVTGCVTGRGATCAKTEFAGASAGSYAVTTRPLHTSGAVHGWELDRWHRDVRAEAVLDGPVGGTLTLVLITFVNP